MDSTIAMDDDQKRGQDFYRLKNYEAAVGCFNRVIARNESPPSSVYDNRAAAYSKLGNLQAALRDGKRMIHAEKAKVTGYLRTGQVLQLLGKEDVALGIYEYGLRNVPVTDPNTKLLRGMYDKLIVRCSPPKAIDPLLMLPLEIAEMVISYLSFNNLVSLLRVSKQWRHLVESMPKLWRNLDLSRATKAVPFSAFRACVKRSRGELTRATLNRCGFDMKKNNVLRYMLGGCKNLNYLEVRAGVGGASLLDAVPLALNLNTLILSHGYEIGLDTVGQLLANCTSLIRAEFHTIYSAGVRASWRGDLSKLRILKLNAGKTQTLGLQVLNLAVLFEKCPELRELSLQKWKSHTQYQWPNFSLLTHLQVLDIAGFQLTRFPELPPSLCTLDMTDCYSMGFASPQSQANLENVKLTELTSFSVSSVKKITIDDLQRLLEPGMGKLKKLDIGGCPFDATDNTALNVSTLIKAGYLNEVVELGLRNTAVTDNIAALIAKSLPRLRTLDVGFTKITGVGVKALVLKPGEMLQHLNLQHCISVSIDAVDYARSKGVDTQFSFPDNMKYGKRIRLGG